MSVTQTLHEVLPVIQLGLFIIVAVVRGPRVSSYLRRRRVTPQDALLLNADDISLAMPASQGGLVALRVFHLLCCLLLFSVYVALLCVTEGSSSTAETIANAAGVVRAVPSSPDRLRCLDLTRPPSMVPCAGYVGAVRTARLRRDERPRAQRPVASRLVVAQPGGRVLSCLL